MQTEVNLEITPRGPKNFSLPEKKVSGNIWFALKLIYPIGLLRKFRSFFAAFPTELITIYFYFFYLKTLIIIVR